MFKHRFLPGSRICDFGAKARDTHAEDIMEQKKPWEESNLTSKLADKGTSKFRLCKEQPHKHRIYMSRGLKQCQKRFIHLFVQQTSTGCVLHISL